MKNEEQIKEAKKKIVNSIESLDSPKGRILSGMLIALNWILENKKGSTLQRLLNGEETRPDA